jgi:hypothetical protein
LAGFIIYGCDKAFGVLPVLLAGDETARQIQFYRIRMRLFLRVVAIRDDRQICTLLVASAFGNNFLDATVTVRHEIHLMLFVAGHGRHHVVIDFQVVQLLG